jgi:hypothetical protein
MSPFSDISSQQMSTTPDQRRWYAHHPKGRGEAEVGNGSSISNELVGGQ